MSNKPTYEELEKRVKELEKSEALYLEMRKTLYEREEHLRLLAEQQEIQKIRERYKALFDRLQEGVYIHDFEGNLIDANIAAKKMLGYDKNENPDLNFASLLSADQAVKALDVINKAKEKGFMDGLMEFKVRRKDGSFADLEIISSVIYRNGKPYAMQGIARDTPKEEKPRRF